MKRPLIIIIIIIFYSCFGFSQKNEFAIGLTNNFCLNFENDQFKYYTDDDSYVSSSYAFGFDFLYKRQISDISNICLYTDYVFNAYFGINNKKGTFMPNGYKYEVNYKDVDEGWKVDFYTNEYLYNYSQCIMNQFTVGSLYQFKIIKKSYFGIIYLTGGILYKNKTYNITDRYAIDYYIWSDMVYNEVDIYTYQETSDYLNDYINLTHNQHDFSIPIGIEQCVNKNNFFISTMYLLQFGVDTYFTININIGFNK